MCIFNWLLRRDQKKCFVKSPGGVGVRGQPFYINLPPSDPRRKRRALARMAICEKNMEKFHPDSEHYKNWKSEWEERKAFLRRYKENN